MQNRDKEALQRLMTDLGEEFVPSGAGASHSTSTKTGLDDIEFPDQPLFDPEEVKHFDLVAQTLKLSPKELALIAKNGFVVTDRLAFKDFTTAYGYIYWKDLPVLVTTDSILWTIYQSYEEILTHVEGTILSSCLNFFLDTARQQLRTERDSNTEPYLAQLHHNLDIYLSVAFSLLNGESDDTPEIKSYVDIATTANQVTTINLFGGEPRDIDFTLFRPRGHYTHGPHLENYFRAMSWLAQIDFRLVTFSPRTGQPTLQLEHIAAASLLRDIIDKADLRLLWLEFDTILAKFFGHSDNMRFEGLDTFLAEAGIKTPANALYYDKPEHLLELLTVNGYGDQQITGQILDRDQDNRQVQPMPRPISFMLMGSRFTLDSYLMSNLVFDRLKVNGQSVNRPLPNPLDVMYLLGNDRALDHLQDELTHYGYRQNLTELRQAVKSFEIGFWTDTFYNRWLNILQTLNNPTTNLDYPQTMRTSAWADKILHTQLASWAQLRHNCLLYVKQSVTTHLEMICQYPAGYVEPYPDFFAAVADFARFGRSLFRNSQLLRLPAQDDWPEHCRATHNKIIAYFDHLADVAGRLQVMAEKELQLEPFTDEETIFLKSVVIRQDYLPQAYGGPSYDQRWNGWYPRLFIYADRSPKKIADIHTNLADNPDSPLYPPRVLYVGTGPVATTLFIADTDEGSTVYVGPSFTYFEVVEKGSPPVRLTDQAWEERLAKTPYPEPPRWTRTFRYPVSCHPDLLNVPNRIDKMSPQQN